MRGPGFLASALACAVMVVGCVPQPGTLPETNARRETVNPAATSGAIKYVGGRYEGDLRGGRPHGRGTFYAEDGSIYRGDFADGRFHGQGRMQYPAGRVVEGRYAEDRPAGAVLTYPDGRRFVGEIVKGRAAGQGTMTFRDGTTQTGPFSYDVMQGRGLQVSASGEVYSGPFSNGQPNGEGLCSRGGNASVCNRRNGQDVTSQTLAQQAQQRATGEVEREMKSKSDEIERGLKPGLDASRSDVNRLATQRAAWSEPEQGDRCYCAITNRCITVGASNSTPAQRARDEIAYRELQLECRRRFADYLGRRDSPDFAQQTAALEAQLAAARSKYSQIEADRQRQLQAVEAEKRRALADQQAMKARADAERQKLENERQRRLDETRNKCSDAKQRAITPCACAAALGTWSQLKGNVCEA